MDGRLDHDAGALTERHKRYLADPEGFEQEHGADAAAQVRAKIRDRYRAMTDEMAYLEQHIDRWQRQDIPIGGKGMFDGDGPSEDDRYQLHISIPDDAAAEITVHEDTAEALSIISSRLDEVFAEHLKGRFEPDPEFHRELDEAVEQGIVSNDDVIRFGLCYATDLSEALTELEDNHEYLDIDQMFGDGALDLLKAFQAGVAATGLGDN